MEVFHFNSYEEFRAFCKGKVKEPHRAKEPEKAVEVTKKPKKKKKEK